MKNDRSKNEIIRIYEYFGNRLTVISFDAETNKRTLTYSGLSLYKALAEKTCKELVGNRCYIVCGKPQEAKRDIGVSISDHIKNMWDNDENLVKKHSRESFTKPFHNLINHKPMENDNLWNIG